MRLPRTLLALSLSTLVGVTLPTFSTAQVAASSTSQPRSSIRADGYQAGYSDGRSDYQNQRPYGVQSHPVYQNADRGYNAGDAVSRQTYQATFRSGYEAGYRAGYYGLGNNPNSERSFNESPAPGAQPSTQPARRAAAAPVAAGTLPAGTSLNLKLNNDLSTANSQKGERFTASVVRPVYAPDGRTVLVPQGSTVAGTVASVQRSGSVSGESRLQLNFETLNLPDGSRLPLRAEVSGLNQSNGIGGAITGTPSTTNEGGVQQSQTRNAVGTAAAGGVVGALLGAIAGGGKGAGIGGLVGAGLGVALATQHGNLNLPAGTPMTITLNEPVRIR